MFEFIIGVVAGAIAWDCVGAGAKAYLLGKIQAWKEKRKT